TTGNYTGMITVQFTSNVSMEGTHTGTQKDDTGMSVLGNVTSGNIISKALLIPVVKDSGQVYVCPGVAALTDVTYTCDNKVKLGLGQTKDGMTLSKVTYDGEEYYLVSNITGTGGAEGSLPVLTDPSVDNLNGNTSSNFTFTVTYTDAENDLASEVEVEIGDNNFTLTEANTFDTDATDGKVYMATYPGSELGAGTFNFKFYASDDIGAIVDSSPVSGLSIEEIISYIISQLPASIVAKLANNLAVDVTLDNQTGLVNVALGAEGEGYIAIVKLNFSQNVDLSSLSLDIDTTEGLSVLGNSEGHPAIVERTLLIPKVDDRNQVFICPGADSLADVTPSCPNVVFINVGETVNGMTASVVNFGGANYFQVTGITGTGGGVVLASNVQTGAPERYYGSGGNINAMGGNITPSNLTVQSQTNAWQGYYGEVTGNLSLADASGDTMYAWTSVTIQGEVLVSLSSSVNWGSLVAQNDCTTGESITGTGSDRVNNTFTASTGPNVNTSIGFNSIIANSSCSTNTYTSSAASTGDAWEEFILSDGSNDVWATIINSNTAGFDGATHDFQVIVPANQSVLTYYFYVELG
ncbi:hypothetical protein KY335_00930, partial [Candidatus Woesearchaeota archaeon]|nr:hypothetical protein [Candidatus Woesearchaeota archaeon]